MKYLLLWCILIFLLPCNGYATESVFFTDSLTNVVLKLPSNAKIEDANAHAYKKATISLEYTDIDIYSVRHPDNQQYDWVYINKFDSEGKYGTLLHSDKLNIGVEGWIRYYSNKTSDNKDFITCVSLIRINHGAMYLVERAWEESLLQSRSIIEASSFPTIKYSRHRGTIRLVDICLFLGTVGFGIVMFLCRRDIKTRIRIILVCLVYVAFLLYMIFFSFIDWSIIISIAILSPFYYYVCIDSNSWNDFYYKANNILRNINN